MISFSVLEEYDTFELKFVSFFPSCPLQSTNSCFASLIGDIAQGPLNQTPFLYEILASALWLTLSFVKCERPAEECIKNLGDTFHCKYTYIREKLVFCLSFTFPTLIDNSNNIEINGLIRLVISGVFLLP